MPAKKKFAINKNLTKWDWIALCAVASAFFVCFLYSDILITTMQSLKLWDCLFDGKLLQFYKANQLADINAGVFEIPAQSAAYDITVYLVFAIWNFPLWILQKLFAVNIFYSLGCLLWMKLIVIGFLGLVVLLTDKICKLLFISEINRKWCAFIMLSSIFTFNSIVIISQYDVISLVFVLLGVYHYIKGDMKRFVLWFAIATTYKLFSVFVFVPLLLLKEKRVFRVMIYFLISILPMALLKIPFLLFGGSNMSTEISFTVSLAQMIFSNPIGLSIGSVPLFILAMVALCILCYIVKIKSEDFADWTIYICFLANAVFFAFSYTHPYWIILLVPYMCILIVKNIKYAKINLLLELFMSLSIVVSYMLFFYWCYRVKVLSSLVLPKIFGMPQGLDFSLPEYIGNLLGTSIEAVTNKLMPFGLAFFIATIAIFAVINCPTFIKRHENSTSLIESDCIDKSVVLWRLAGSTAVCIIPLILYFNNLM